MKIKSLMLMMTLVIATSISWATNLTVSSESDDIELVIINLHAIGEICIEAITKAGGSASGVMLPPTYNSLEFDGMDNVGGIVVTLRGTPYEGVISAVHMKQLIQMKGIHFEVKQNCIEVTFGRNAILSLPILDEANTLREQLKKLTLARQFSHDGHIEKTRMLEEQHAAREMELKNEMDELRSKSGMQLEVVRNDITRLKETLDEIAAKTW